MPMQYIQQHQQVREHQYLHPYREHPVHESKPLNICLVHV